MPLSIGIILAVIPFVYLQTKKAPEAKAGWFDENWLYRKSIPVTYTGSENLTEYQVLLDGLDTATLITNKQLQSDCDDLRFTNSTGTILPYFIVGATCNTTDTEIFVKTDRIPASSVTLFMYYGNPLAGAGHNEQATFSYATEKTVAYLLGDQDSGFDWSGNVRILSLYNGNSISHDGTTVNLNFFEYTAAFTANDYEPITAKGLVSISDGDQSEIPTPVSWAGTEFTGVTTTISQNDTYYIISPWAETDISLYVNGSSQSSCGVSLPYTISAGGSVQMECNLTDSANYRITTTDNVPILILYANERSTNGDRFPRPLYPAQDSSGQPLYGYDSAGYITNNGTSTNYSYIMDSDATATTGTLSANSILTPTEGSGARFAYTSGPFKIISTTSGGTISGAQIVDGDGTDATSWVGRREFGTILGMYSTTEFVAPVSDQAATCTTFNDDGTTKDTETLTSTNGEVYGLSSNAFGTNTSTTYEPNQWYMKCDKPVYAWWQNTSDAEKHTVTWPMMRQFTYPTPTTGTFGSEEKTPGPAGFWKFDEGADNTCTGGSNDVCDTTNGRNDGTNSNATWQTADKCITGKCLYFNGSTSVATISSSSTQFPNIDFTKNLASGSTFETWFKVNSDGENSTGEIYDKGTNTYARVTNEGSDNLGDLEVKLDLATTDAAEIVPNIVVLNKWHHLAVTYTDDGDDEITIYLDGVQVGSSGDGDGNATAGSGSPATDGNSLLIGGDSSNNFHGFIDEFKIYAYERTAAEIKTDFQKNSTKAGSSVSAGFKEQDFLNQNLVGYWTMNDSSGNATDSSGNSITLTNSGTATYAAGKFSNSVDVNGSSQHLYSADNSDLSITGQVTLSAWVNPDTVTGTQTIAGKWDGANESYLLSLNGSAVRMSIDASGNYAETTSGALTTGSYQHVVGVYDSSAATVSIFVNGVKKSVTVTGTIPTSIADDAGRFSVGAEDSTSGTTNYFNGKVDDLRLYSRALNANEVAALFKWTPSTTSYAVKPSIVGRWKLDDGYADTAQDSGSSNIDGNLAGGTSCPSAGACPTWTAGKIDKALDFDGSDDYVEVTDSAVLDITGDFTLAAWIYPDTLGSSRAIVSKRDTSSNNGGYSLTLGGNGEVYCQTNSGSGTTNSYTANGAVTASAWYHVAAVRSGTSCDVYINGAKKTNSYGTHTTLAANNLALRFGRSPNSTEPFDGKIDEVHVYSTALSPVEVATVYNGLSTYNVGVTGNSETATIEIPAANLKGHWKMDENTGSSLSDLSGNANNSTSVNNTTWTPGKFGAALSFNGTTSNVTWTDDADFDFAAANSFSISAWVKTPSTASRNYFIVSKADGTNGGYKLYMDASGDFCFAVDDDASWTPDDAACTVDYDYDDGEWHHLLAKKTGTTRLDLYVDGYLASADTSISATGTLANSGSLYLGVDSDGTSNEWEGTIDEVKIFDAAATNLQASYLALRNDPLAWWRFDECVGTTIYDTGTYEYNGTMTPGASGTTSVGTCETSATSSWYNGRNGKYNSGLDFDGTDDYVTIPDASSKDAQMTHTLDFFDTDPDFSISGWFNRDTFANDHTILAKRNGIAAGDAGYLIYVDDSTDKLIFEVSDATDEYSVTSTATFTSTGWNHFAIVWDDDNAGLIKMYINGVEDTTAVHSGTLAIVGNLANAVELRIGSESDGANYFDGKLDDIRFFRYTLSANQVRLIYNNGSVNF